MVADLARAARARSDKIGRNRMSRRLAVFASPPPLTPFAHSRGIARNELGRYCKSSFDDVNTRRTYTYVQPIQPIRSIRQYLNPLHQRTAVLQLASDDRRSAQTCPEG